VDFFGDVKINIILPDGESGVLGKTGKRRGDLLTGRKLGSGGGIALSVGKG